MRQQTAAGDHSHRISPKKRAVAERSSRSDCGHAVPLLAEILDAFPGVLWNIEIKNYEAWAAAMPVLRGFSARAGYW